MAAIDEGATAEEAIDRVTAAQAEALAAVDDEYFRERAADLRDVGRRVVEALTGRARPPLHRSDGLPAVLAADDLDPSLVVAIRPELVTGIALAGGAPTGHAAIVARALGIPLALGLGAGVGAALDGAEVAVDGTAGRLLVEPDEADLVAARPPRPRSPAAATAEQARDLPVEVSANVGIGARGGGGGGRRRGRHRSGPDRAPVPRPIGPARARRAALALPPDRGRDAGHAGRVPDARHRRRQARAVPRGRRRDEPGARGPRHPAQPRPAATCSKRSSARCSRRIPDRPLRHPAADGLDGRGGGRRARGGRASRGGVARRGRGRRRGRSRRGHDRDPVGRGHGRRVRAGRRLLQHRHERPRPVRAGGRSDERVAGGARDRRSSPRSCGSFGPSWRPPGLTTGTSRSAARPPPTRLRRRCSSGWAWTISASRRRRSGRSGMLVGGLDVERCRAAADRGLRGGDRRRSPGDRRDAGRPARASARPSAASVGSSSSCSAARRSS